MASAEKLKFQKNDEKWLFFKTMKKIKNTLCSRIKSTHKRIMGFEVELRHFFGSKTACIAYRKIETAKITKNRKIKRFEMPYRYKSINRW